MDNNTNDVVVGTGGIIKGEKKILNRQRNLILFIVALDMIVLFYSYDMHGIANNIWNALYALLDATSGWYLGPPPGTA